MSAPWKPERPVQIIAGTPPGGGLDRVARALERAIVSAKLVDVPVEVVNVPGDGARRAWTHCVDHHPGDGHVIAISSPNLVSDFLVGIASFEHSRYTPIATLVTEYIAFAVAADSTLTHARDLLTRFGSDAGSLTVALSTALGNPNHVALAKLIKQAGGAVDAPTIRVFDTALDAVADVVAGNAEVCAVTAASVLKELAAGRVRVLALSAPTRLAAPFTNTPIWRELGMACVIGAWRGVTGPSGLTPAQVAYWADVVTAATAQSVWHEELARLSWSPLVQTGETLDRYLADERAEFVAVLGELGLLKV